ncbi:hypothetical protein BMW23_1130 [Bodo saltans virus]|uniref:Uncharacterized protein n=1 Tax=Bodo saltans virus TaxID=2024608 RepID=A0A2H4UW58_9VIRU|nr:hypothetical protein QJ851_gp1110 [Bodo saltans virus]ATZ81173.1 hypothetical protein BMW23_1130 [Bodo saltans virus]
MKECIYCDYKTCDSRNWRHHVNTKKHKRRNFESERDLLIKERERNIISASELAEMENKVAMLEARL